MTGNPECKSTSHALHLCALRACGLDDHSDDIFTKLVGNPQFVCQHCKDKANKAENLCKPEKLQV